MSDTNSPVGRALPRPEPGSPDEDIHDVLAEMNADLARLVNAALDDLQLIGRLTGINGQKRIEGGAS